MQESGVKAAAQDLGSCVERRAGSSPVSPTINPYGEHVVYGPYTGKDARLRVELKFTGIAATQTISYPKYVMEMKLGRLLTLDEMVHHIDEDMTNNDEDNFEVVSRSTHGVRHTKHPDTFEVPCRACGTILVLTKRQHQTLQSNLKRAVPKLGPYCYECRPKNQHT